MGKHAVVLGFLKMDLECFLFFQFHYLFRHGRGGVGRSGVG